MRLQSAWRRCGRCTSGWPATSLPSPATSQSTLIRWATACPLYHQVVVGAVGEEVVAAALVQVVVEGEAVAVVLMPVPTAVMQLLQQEYRAVGAAGP